MYYAMLYYNIVLYNDYFVYRYVTGKRGLNPCLQAVGQKGFTQETLSALRDYLATVRLPGLAAPRPKAKPTPEPRTGAGGKAPDENAESGDDCAGPPPREAGEGRWGGPEDGGAAAHREARAGSPASRGAPEACPQGAEEAAAAAAAPAPPPARGDGPGLETPAPPTSAREPSAPTPVTSSVLKHTHAIIIVELTYFIR